MKCFDRSYGFLGYRSRSGKHLADEGSVLKSKLAAEVTPVSRGNALHRLFKAL
jgi:hypothetical protein